MKKALILLVCASFFSCTTQQVQQTLGTASEVLGSDGGTAALTNGEVISGLKEALEVGTRKSVSLTSVTDGFLKNDLIRIPFPEEAIKVKNTLNDVGMSKVVDDFETTLNRAAEEASKEAVPIFVDGITSMSIQDGFAILQGGEGAATNYLKDKTTQNLIAAFSPVVERATAKVELTKAWTPVVNAYNTATLLTGGGQVDPDLNAYVTNKAIDGLFLMISKEEDKIRQDPLARTSDLLKKVFSQAK